jgi:hypothetical protein
MRLVGVLRRSWLPALIRYGRRTGWWQVRGFDASRLIEWLTAPKLWDFVSSCRVRDFVSSCGERDFVPLALIRDFVPLALIRDFVPFALIRDVVAWHRNCFFPAGQDRGVAAEIAAELVGVVVVNRTGMRQRLGDAEFVQFIDDLTRLNFELPRQLIDSNLTHV